MKRVHTQAKKANRPQNKNYRYRGLSRYMINALFGRKINSQTSNNRVDDRKVYRTKVK